MRIPPSVARLAMRARGRLPSRAWQAMLELGSLVTDVPSIGLPDFRRVVVLAPHPDDETIGCGGTIALLADRGATVHVLVATDGEATIGAPLPRDEIARRRRRETEAACRILGTTAPPRFLGLPDGGLAGHRRELTASIQEALDEHRPQLVLAPWLLDHHPDHLEVARAVARVDPTPGLQVWGYEAHTPVLPTRAVATTDVAERKLAALREHVTAAAAFDVETTMALDRWRSLLTDLGNGHAEAFHAVTFEDHAALAALPALR